MRKQKALVASFWVCLSRMGLKNSRKNRGDRAFRACKCKALLGLVKLEDLRGQKLLVRKAIISPGQLV